MLSIKGAEMDNKVLAEHKILAGNKRFLMRVYDTDTNIPYLEITVHERKDGLWFENGSFTMDYENIWAFSMLLSASLHDYMLMWEPISHQLINPCEFNRDGVYWSKPEVKKLREMLEQSIDIDTIARYLNCSPKGVQRKIKKLEPII